MMKRRKNVYKRYHYLIIAFMSVFSVIMMYPMAWMLVTSFKSNADIHKNKEKFFPAEWTVEGYRSAFEKAPIGDWLVNSIVITAVITFAVILTSTLIGYVFAKYEFKFKRSLFLLMLATMMVPPQVTMIPRYLCEAAKMDGAGPLRIYWSVILPNIKPAIGSIGIFTAMANWNDYLDPLLMLNDIDKMTLPLGLVMFDSQRSVDLAATMAAAAMIMMPMILIFVLFQRQFIKGMTMSGIK